GIVPCTRRYPLRWRYSLRAMARTVELRRHTASEGDALTLEGVRAAVEIGGRLQGAYDSWFPLAPSAPRRHWPASWRAWVCARKQAWSWIAPFPARSKTAG